MALPNFVSEHIFLTALVIVGVYFLLRYLYNKEYNKEKITSTKEVIETANNEFFNVDLNNLGGDLKNGLENKTERTEGKTDNSN